MVVPPGEYSWISGGGRRGGELLPGGELLLQARSKVARAQREKHLRRGGASRQVMR